jgi:YHS domain-containing protein
MGMKTFSIVLSFLVIASVLGAQEDQLPTAPPADAQAIQKINALGGGAMPLAANTNLLSVNFSLVGAKIDDAALESLKGVSEQLVWLNLANTSVTDAGLKVLAGFKNLRRLHLEKTGVGDDGLASVKGLGELQYLNLYGTKVTDKGVAALGGLKKLKNVYLWQTAVSDAGAAELAKALPGLYINRGIDPPAKVVEIAAPAPAPAPAAAKAINAKCPISGKDIDASKTSVYKTQTIAFCCADCKAKFDAEPAKFIGKVAEFKEPAPAAAPAGFANIKEVMALHKGKESFLANILAGKGSDDDLKKLVSAYDVLAAQKPPTGDEASWKNLTAALSAAAKEAAAKKDGALDKLKAASNCKACHELHKPKK